MTKQETKDQIDLDITNKTTVNSITPELVGNNCSLMIGNLIKQQFLQNMNWPLGSVTSIVMTLAVLAISLLVGFFASRSGGLKYASK